MIAWLEAAAVRAAAPFAGAGETIVGTEIRVRHVRPARVGGRVEVSARPLPATADRRLTFLVRAVDGPGRLVATGEIDRAVVDRRRFLEQAADPAADR
ncbi:thioesterase family protein [Streptomyces broussonetiae]|uniref:thioesterase family protein n=1 Tax=Streptomyces broussonetiae TaxID=2686304 RepID=UPI001E4A6762|nr:hotdog domain-containing protein [Streptomyces broussonetiae]